MALLRFGLILSVMIALTVPSTSADDLTFVESESTIDFVGTKPGGKHKGGFQKFTVNSEANFEDPSKSSISFEIDAKSVWSDDDKLTNHLKSPDFFDVRNNPTITFESTKIVPGEKDGDKATATITGDLMMLGKTVEIEVPIEAVVSEKSVTLKAKFSIDRTKWGMTYGQGKIDNDVQVAVDIAFKR